MKLFLCFVLALKLVSAQYQSYGYGYDGYNVGQPQYYTFDQHQLQQHQLQQHQLQQHQLQQPQQHQQQFAAGQYDQSGEPIVGSPLLPGLIRLQLAKPFIFGVPGLRMSKLNMGRIGGLSYANSLLGAANPNAQEESSADPNTMAYQYAADDYQFNQPAEQQAFAHGANAEQEVAAPQYYQQAQTAQGANQEFWPHWHWANQEQEQVSAPMYYPQAESQVGAQPANQQFGHHWHFANPEQEVAAQQPSYQANDYSSVGGSQYNQFQPIVAPQQFQDEQSNANERWSSWGDHGKKEYKKVVYQKEFYKPVINKDPCAKCDCKKIYKHDHDHHDFHKTKGITKIISKDYYEHKPHAPTYAIAPSSPYGSQYGTQYGPHYGSQFNSQYSPYVSAAVSSRNDITTSTKKPEAAEKNEKKNQKP